MADQTTTARVLLARHAEIVKLCEEHGLTVQAGYDALLVYATANVARIDEAIAEHHARASSVVADRRKRESG